MYLTVDAARREMCTLVLAADLDARAGIKLRVGCLVDGCSMLVCWW